MSGDNEEQMLDYSVRYINVSSFSDKVTVLMIRNIRQETVSSFFCFTELMRNKFPRREYVCSVEQRSKTFLMVKEDFTSLLISVTLWTGLSSKELLIMQL